MTPLDFVTSTNPLDKLGDIVQYKQIIVAAMKREALLMRSNPKGVCGYRQECSSKAFCISNDRTPDDTKFPSSGKRGIKPNQLKGERLREVFRPSDKRPKWVMEVWFTYERSINKALDCSGTC